MAARPMDESETSEETAPVAQSGFEDVYLLAAAIFLAIACVIMVMVKNKYTH
jgi:hypothetical protein